MIQRLLFAQGQSACMWETAYAANTGVPFTRIFWHQLPDGQNILTLWDVE